MRRKRRIIIILLLMTLLLMTVVLMTGCGADASGAVESSPGSEEAPAAEAAEPEFSPEAEAEDVAENESPDTDEDRSEEAESFLETLPAWGGYAFCYVNGNRPDFEPDEIWTSTQESLDPLDELGRCGTARSCIGQDGMPTEARGNISSVEPTGWHTDRYDFVEGEALYNRCHLIGHQLSGDDAVPRNLITGTSYMNRDGMLPFENAIASYVKASGNHVMYQVSPVFLGEELVARGVHLKAVSVEDEGTGLAFNVFCYNVQPGIEIDYQSGDNALSENTKMLLDYQAGRFVILANTKGELPNDSLANDSLAEDSLAEDSPAEDGAQPPGDSDEKEERPSPVRTYILNTNTGKFHYPGCRSVQDMKEKNKQEVEATREEIIERGFSPCGNCKP